jgi:4-amino-4-deoxy-L-arabinose transferase
MSNSKSPEVNWQRYALILLLMYLIIYIMPLGVRPVMIPDEVRYAEIPREMITTGNWISPHLNGLRYFEKPVLGYWVTGISMQVFGDNAFAMRLPSALSAGLSALALFMLLSRFTQRRTTALNAAMIYLSMLGVFLIGTMNVLDSVFSFLLTAAFVSFYFSHKESDSKKRLVYLLLLGLFCGGAFLAKGFLAFVLLGAVIGPYVIWQGRWQELFTRGWIALFSAIVVIAPWAVLVHLQEPEYWHYFFWEEHVKRFASEEAQHGKPIWYYLMFLPLLSLPWIAQLPMALKNLFVSEDGNDKDTDTDTDTGKDSDLLKYSILWFLMPFIFFSISRGKLPTYILPCLAPLAVILAVGIENYLSDKNAIEPKVGYKIANAFVAAFFLIVALALVLIQTGIVGKPVWSDGENWKWITLVCAFLSGAVLLLLSAKNRSLNRRLSLQALSVVAVMFVISIGLPQRTAMSKMPGDFLLEHADKIKPDTILFSDDILIHSVNWFYKRSDVYMTGAGESKHGLSFSDSSHRLIEGEDLKQFITEHLNKDEMVIVHHSDADAKMQAIMPAQAQQSRWGKFVLWYIPLQEGMLLENPTQQGMLRKETRGQV